MILMAVDFNPRGAQIPPTLLKMATPHVHFQCLVDDDHQHVAADDAPGKYLYKCSGCATVIAVEPEKVETLQGHIDECTKNMLSSTIQAQLIHHNIPSNIVSSIEILSPLLSLFGVNIPITKTVWPTMQSLQTALRAKRAPRVAAVQQKIKSQTQSSAIQLGLFYSAKLRDMRLRLAWTDEEKGAQELCLLPIHTNVEEEKHNGTVHIAPPTTTLSINAKNVKHTIVEFPEFTAKQMQQLTAIDHDLRHFLWTHICCNDFVDTAYLCGISAPSSMLKTMITAALKEFGIERDGDKVIYCTVSNNAALYEACIEQSCFDPLVDFAQLLWLV